MPKQDKPNSFSISECIAQNNGKHEKSGNNWSYASFPTQRDMAAFMSDANLYGYRTRNEHQSGGYWWIQYHHYED